MQKAKNFILALNLFKNIDIYLIYNKVYFKFNLLYIMKTVNLFTLSETNSLIIQLTISSDGGLTAIVNEFNLL